MFSEMDENASSNESEELNTIQLYLKSLENKYQDETVTEEHEFQAEDPQKIKDSFTEENVAVYTKIIESDTTQPVIIVANGDEVSDGYSNTISPNLVLAVNESDSKLYKIPVSSQGNALITEDGESYRTITVMSSDINAEQLGYILLLADNADEYSENGKNVLFTEPKVSLGEKRSNNFLKFSNYEQNETLLKERKSNNTSEYLMCNKCNYSTTKKYLLRRHIKTHSDDRPFECEICHRAFKTIHAVRNHVNIHTNTRPHPCTFCNSAFTTSGELVRHTRYKHTHEKPHKCFECGYASVELSKLKRHMRCHTGERPYRCPYCSYASPDTYKLKRHIRIHTGEKPYVCNICNSAFSQSNTLKAHYLVHSNNKPCYRCVYCSATCTRKTDLKNHVQKLHAIGQTLKCRKCKRIFNTRYSFKVHRRTCDGQRFFVCEVCSFTTVSQQHLETHKFIHVNHVQYQCSLCDEIFDDKKQLELHNILKHDIDQPFTKVKSIMCPECGKAFRFHGNMVRHSALHNPEATFSEKEEASRIGQSKEPGELRDGEEDDFSDDEGCNMEPGASLSVHPSNQNKPTIIENWVLMGNNDIDSDEETTLCVDMDNENHQVTLSEEESGKKQDRRADELSNLKLPITKMKSECFDSPLKKAKSAIIHVLTSHQTSKAENLI